MASELGVFENTIRNWFADTDTIKWRDVKKIKALHVKLRGKIRRAQ